jgi:hypothetical protein
LDRAEAGAKAVLVEARRLSRTWMQSGMVDLLAMIAARRGPGGAELAAWLTRQADEIGFHPSASPQAEAALARGAWAEALGLADSLAERSAQLGLQRACIIAREQGLRALAGLERWEELLARAATALAESEAANFRTRTWRILATRAQARDASGDAGGARDDRSAARALVDEMAARIADPRLRAAFQADPMALEVKNG